METYELLWEILPEGLKGHFDLRSFEKTATVFRITLLEKNEPGDVPKRYRGKKIVSTTMDDIIIDDFPIRGRKGELVLKRRSWKFEGVDEWYRRAIQITAPGTKLEKEFAIFLKEFDRECSSPG